MQERSGTGELYIARVLSTPANPLFPGWYADPEVAVFGGRVWVYPTCSAPFDDQTFLDAFSSPDLTTWTRHERVLSSDTVPWARRAVWAPCCVEDNGRYYLFFGANDIHEGEVGGIGVAVGDDPAGPFVDHLGHPLIGTHENGAQPIDQCVFRDGDRWYMAYGGWGVCNLCRLSADFRSVEPFDDGTRFRPITPVGYREGPYFFKRRDVWYFMWSEGDWADGSYQVAYATADTPDGPWPRRGTVIEPRPGLATGAGHNSVLNLPGTEDWFLVYHRRPAGEVDMHHRVPCMDRLRFAADGSIVPVTMT